MNKMANKRRWENEHFRLRLIQGYGIPANKAVRREMVGLIQSGQSTPVEKQSNRIVLHSINYQGREIVVVYDKARKNLVTALRPEWVEGAVRFHCTHGGSGHA